MLRIDVLRYRPSGLLACAVALSVVATLVACGPPGEGAKSSIATTEGAPAFTYPQQRVVEGHVLLLHAPQIHKWPAFASFDALMAIEFSPADGSARRYGTASVSGATEVDLGARLVHVRNPKVDSVLFTEPAPKAYTDAVKGAATRAALDVPLDLFLAYVADDVLKMPTPAGFSTEPPTIYVRTEPTILLFVNGAPALQPLESTGLQVLVNANWPTFKSPQGSVYYLLARDRWLTASNLEGPWSEAAQLPTEFAKIKANGANAAIRAAVPAKSTAQPLPAVLTSAVPAELIVTEGPPQLEEIRGASGLAYVRNTTSPLFRFNQQWYFLASGRWFSAANLDAGAWTFVTALPSAFSDIPPGHAMAPIRSSVAGTPEARMAALEALLPRKSWVARNTPAPVKVSYAGDPVFEPVQGTSVQRAVNTRSDVIEYQGKYYLCYSGAWYEANSPTGPWLVSAAIPAQIYSIPPSSPSYAVTQVTVLTATPTTVVYSYPPSYSSNVYVVHGVPVYGTGWYYPPYNGGGFYYPYVGSYGHGSWYNPASGAFGSRSVSYGPYGGHTYNQAYNPRTGRYGYAETAWDNDEWISYGETFNPRTGVYTETSRSFDESSQQLSTTRTAQRGNESVTTERERDFGNQSQNVTRDSTRGATQQTQREVQDGKLTGSSTVKSADGRTMKAESEISGGQGSVKLGGSQGGTGAIEASRNARGVTRQGSFTDSSGETLSSSTQRSGNVTRTELESSTGGKATSTSQGLTRTTVGESSTGDLYAGQNGSVYKKTDNGWSHYESGGWQSVNTPTPNTAQQQQIEQARSQMQQGTAGGQTQAGQVSTSLPDSSQLNRDFSARQIGTRQFAQRGGLGGGGRRR